MRFLFAALLALATGVALTLFAQQDPGYIMMSYRGWSVETSLTLLLLAVLLSFVVLYLALRLLWGIWQLPLSLHHWLRRRRQRVVQRRTQRGLLALAEGHWALAERQLSKAAQASETPLISFLGAAQAAQQQGSTRRRDLYLAQAYQSMPEAKLAVGLTQAKLQLAQGELEQALASLREMRRIAPRHEHVLQLLKALYERLESWSDLQQLLPELRRHHLLEGEALVRFEVMVFSRLIDDSATLDKLEACWHEIPKRLRQQPELLERYTRRLLNYSANAQANELLENYLKRHYHPGLAALYGELGYGDPNHRLAFLERWLKEFGEDPQLLLAVGRLSLRDQLWGKARAYLEASLGREDRLETRHELAELLIRLGEQDKALALYRQPNRV